MKIRCSLMPYLVCLAVCCGTARASQQPYHQRLPNLDKRQTLSTFTNSAHATRSAAADRVRSATPGARIDFDEVTGSPRRIASTKGFLTGPDGNGLAPASLAAIPAQDPHRVTKAFIHEHRNLFGHGPEALDAARIKRDFVTPHNGMKTVAWQQELDGIEVFDSVLISHTTSKGELVSVNSTFVRELGMTNQASAQGRAAQRAKPAISPRRAVTLAAANLGESLKEENMTQKMPASGVQQRQQFQRETSKEDMAVQLIWLPMSARELRLCWDVVLPSRTRREMFRVLVDAQTGEVLLRHCLTMYLSDATYNVFTNDSPSPFSPGHATPLPSQPPFVARTLVTISALNTTASPNGWIDDGVNETRGNNVNAHTHLFSLLPFPLGGDPPVQGSSFRVFDFPLDLSQYPTNYANAAVVQLFYWCNWMHDKLYQLGFTEAAGNFQKENFGRGGEENDEVQANAQVGAGWPPRASADDPPFDRNNANMTVLPEGLQLVPPLMQMFLWDGPAPERDGDLDAEIILHEYTHGLSNRRVGGGLGLCFLQSQGLGEGWSDFYALSMLSEPGDNLNGNYAQAAYASYHAAGFRGDGGLTSNYYYGGRRYPYSTALTKNPLTFKDIDPGQANAHSGVPASPRYPFGTFPPAEEHFQGEVWCVMLWEARANLITKYGYAVGNQLILQLVTDGMNLSPGNPNFVEARDAILQADLVNTGGANLPELWAAFAKRGLGYSATSPLSSTTTGVHESFDVPSVAPIEDNPRVTDVPGQFRNLKHHGEALGFHLGKTPDPDNFCGRSYRGIVRKNGVGTPYFFLSRRGNPNLGCVAGDYKPGSISVVRMGSRGTDGERLRSNRLKPDQDVKDTTPPYSDLGVATVLFDGNEYPNFHTAGGMQMLGDVLLVPLKNPKLFQFVEVEGFPVPVSSADGVAFLDVSNPEHPSLMRFVPTENYRIPITALEPDNAVGCVRLDDGRYLMALLDRGSHTMELFLSGGADLRWCAFPHWKSYAVPPACITITR